MAPKSSMALSSTTVIANDPQLKHSLPALSFADGGGSKTVADYLEPSTEMGIRAAQMRAGQKRENRVQVSVRIRPVTKADKGQAEQCVSTDGFGNVEITKPGGEPLKFSYDNVFTEGQDEVYDLIGKPMVESAFEGYNVTLFAYGQTAAGKTHSIMGYNGDEGVVPRFCKGVLGLSQVKLEDDPNLTIRMSMTFVELYNEQIRDLLEKKAPGQKELTELQLRERMEGKTKKTFIENVTLHTILTWERVQELLDKGNAARKVAATNMNDQSSRSHSIIIFKLLQKYEGPGIKKDLESTINIVDLAGSERQSKTGAEGAQLDEAKKINHSLLTLGVVLNSFSKGKGTPPLRDSKLTRILAESFGGNARTWMLACVSGSIFNLQESVSTLSYAASAKKVVNKAQVNAKQANMDAIEKCKQLQLELTERYAEIEELKLEIEKLRAQKDGREMVSQDAATVANTFGAVVGAINTGALGSGGNIFIGRAKLSLKSCVLQKSNYTTLPLITTNPDWDGATLTINTWPVSEGEEVITEYDDDQIEVATAALLGKRFDFCVHVISAADIPEGFTNRVYCRYVFAKKEQKPLQTEEVSGTSDPKWDYKKRFAWNQFTADLGEYLSGNVLTFEVLGYPN